MESMRRSEANNSHHPNKVAVNSIVTESNNFKSSGSGSLNNNNNNNNNNTKISYSLQQQHIKAQLASAILHKPAHLTTKDIVNTKITSSSSSGTSTAQSSSLSSSQNTSSNTTTSSSTSSTSSESKESNFEYDDNEWDVGGIGDLIIDLDADIEKSASTTTTAVTAANQSSEQNPNLNKNLTNKPGNADISVPSKLENILNANEQSQIKGISSLSTNSLSSRTNSSNSLSSTTSLSSGSNTSPNKSNQKSDIFPNTLQGGGGSILQKSLSAPVNTSGYSSTSSSSSSSSSILSPSLLTSKINSNPNFNKIQHPKIGPHQNLKLQQPSLVAQLNNKSTLSDNTARFPSPTTGINRNSAFVNPNFSGNLIKPKPNTLSSPLGTNSSGQSTNFNSLNSSSQNSSGINSVAVQSNNTGNSSMSQPGGTQGAGKSATKMSIDHQATLDKGLKMKIKRTKPGTKSSEAKHEIVKAEQNGTAGIEGSEINSTTGQQNSLIQNINNTSVSGGNTNLTTASGGGGGKNKHNNQMNQTNQSITNQPQPLSSVTANNTPAAGNKRGSSGHRREKGREKQPHSRDKSEQHNNSNNSNSSNSNSSNMSSSNLSNSTSSSNNSISINNNSSSVACNCSHEVNGTSNLKSNCTSANCIRNRSNSNSNLDQSSNRLTGQVQSNSLGGAQSISSTGLHNSNSNNSSLGHFNSSNNNTGSSSSANNNLQSSSPNTPNAPGPPGGTTKGTKTNVLANSGGNNHSQHNQQNQLQNLNLNNSQSQINNMNSGSGNIMSNSNSNSQQNSLNIKSSNSGPISATIHHTISTNIKMNCDDDAHSPPAKRIKTEPKDTVDVCIGTSIGTITEPDCLGPCEPGTSVTLEGIVWHETEGGVLVVNVTWRGKTYVGTLLDCTRHDWAPPRFCDSPTEELDSRTPKGRAKRGRSANLAPDLMNFTETRSSVHSKLRNGGPKGRGGKTTTGGTTTPTSTSTTTQASSNGLLTTTTIANASGIPISSSNSSTTPSPSPTGFLPPRSEKRKSKDESPSPVNGESGLNSDTSQNGGNSGNNNGQSTQIIVNPITGLNVQISNKKCKTASPCAISPVLLECPEQDCNKKYKHANGLRYHQSHAHGSGGSMDEDSSTLPESPIRMAPPTTPSPAPPCTPPVQPSNTTVSPPNNGSAETVPVTSTVSTTNISPVTVTQATTIGSSPTQPTPSTIALNIASPAPVVSVTSSGAPITSNIIGSSPLMTPIPSAVTNNIPHQNISQHTVAGGSITAGISNQALSAQHLQQQQNQQPQQQLQHQQNHPNQGHPLLGPQNPGTNVPNQNNLLQNNQMMSEQQIGGQNNPMLQQTPSNLHSGLNTPNRGDQPIKPGVLRFVPPTQDSSNPGNMSLQQSPLRASLNQGNLPETGPFSQSPNSQGIPLNKNQNFNKQKKSRKSPGPGDFDNQTSRDDAHSPAYSDISDDSPSAENDLTGDKSKPPQMQDMGKKPGQESGQPPPISSMGGYGMYQFYAQQPYMVPPQQPDHQNNPQGLQKHPSSQQQSSGGPPSGLPPDFNKNKDPPLDLMTKPQSQQGGNQNNEPNSKENPSGNAPVQPIPVGPGPPGKPMPHFYPFNYMPAGYPYNVDPNYGPVPVVSDDGKISGGPPNQPPPLKDDNRTKESPSPHGIHDINKIGGQSPQLMANKMPNQQQKEQQMKDMNKEQNIQSQNPKESPTQQVSTYPGIYQRHPNLGVPPQQIPQSHLSRDEELRRYYIYSDQQRRAQQQNQAQNPNNNPPITQIKPDPDGPPQQNPNLHHPSPQLQQQQHQQQMSQSSQQQQQQQMQQNSGPIKPIKPTPQPASMMGMNNQKPGGLIKDIKEEKDVKIKQEGQKPTMETQGPPPPPTSQYFLHPSYISPGPFGFDPNHPMYRNVLMSATPYNASPYHIPMARFHAPEDLSRNPNTKALDALHHAASQYYTTHKIHELSERAIKSPTSNNPNSGNLGGNPNKVSNVSSPNVTQSGNVSGPNNSNIGGPNVPNGPQQGLLSSPNVGSNSGPINLQPTGVSGGPMGNLSGPNGPPPMQKGGSGGGVNDPITGKQNVDPSSIGKQIGGGGPPGGIGVGGPGGIGVPAGADSRSPPPQRHVHTHHHTHVGLGYPMYPAPYGAAVLASQQAAAVAVINPFPPGPNK